MIMNMMKPKIKVNCDNCGKEMLRKPSQTGFAHHFCNKKCRAEWEKGTKKVPRAQCPTCGKMFYLAPCLKKRSKSGLNFCSYKCRAITINPPRHSRGRIGKREDLGNILFRSTWEANFARYLNHIKSQGIVREWFFENDKFNLGIYGIYIVDFKVIYSDGQTIYYEVKGVMDKRSEKKINAFRILYPNKKLILVMGKEMKIIGSVYHKILKGWEYGSKRRELREMQEVFKLQKNN